MASDCHFVLLVVLWIWNLGWSQPGSSQLGTAMGCDPVRVPLGWMHGVVYAHGCS